MNDFISALDLHNLIEAQSIPITGVAYRGGENNHVNYDDTATIEQMAEGDSIAAGFNSLSPFIAGDTITCQMDIADTTAFLFAYDDNGELYLGKNIAVSNGELTHTIENINSAGEYKLVIYGIISNKSGFCSYEVE